MNHLWSNRSRQVSYAALVCLGCMLTTVSRAGISVEPAWTLPVYERATGEQQAWVTNNMRSVVIKSAGGFQKSFAIGNPTLTTMCSLGHGTSSRRPDYYFGDQMTPPDPPAGYTLDWESMTNSAAVKSGAVVLAPSVSAVYLSSAGMVSIEWRYVNATGQTTAQTNEYYCSQGARKRPYRAHWTDAPYNAPAVDLRGKFVSFHFQPGSELKQSDTTITNINGIVEEHHSPGLSINDAGQLQVYGQVSGMCLMQYFQTGSKQEQVGLDGGMIVVEVLAPAVILQSVGLGEELRPLRKAYENAMAICVRKFSRR